jgi:hypothetical protein
VKVSEIPQMINYFGYDTIIGAALNESQYILASYLINKKLDNIYKTIGSEFT